MAIPEHNETLIDLDPCIDSVITIYDRYFQVAITDISNPLVSFEDFVNQLIIRGITEYDKQLAAIEKSLGIKVGE